MIGFVEERLIPGLMKQIMKSHSNHNQIRFLRSLDAPYVTPFM